MLLLIKKYCVYRYYIKSLGGYVGTKQVISQWLNIGAQSQCYNCVYISQQLLYLAAEIVKVTLWLIPTLVKLQEIFSMLIVVNSYGLVH